MEKVYLNEPMDLHMMGNEKMTKLMDMEDLLIVIKMYMKEVFIMIRLMVLELILINSFYFQMNKLNLFQFI